MEFWRRQSIRSCEIFIQEDTAYEGEGDATTSIGKERAARFGHGFGLHGHVRILRAAARYGIGGYHSSFDRTGNHVSGYRGRLWLRRQRSVGRAGDSGNPRQSFSGDQ